MRRAGLASQRALSTHSTAPRGTCTGKSRHGVEPCATRIHLTTGSCTSHALTHETSQRAGRQSRRSPSTAKTQSQPVQSTDTRQSAVESAFRQHDVEASYGKYHVLRTLNTADHGYDAVYFILVRHTFATGVSPRRIFSSCAAWNAPYALIVSRHVSLHPCTSGKLRN